MSYNDAYKLKQNGSVTLCPSLSAGPPHHGVVVFNSSSALPDSLPASFALLAGKHHSWWLKSGVTVPKKFALVVRRFITTWWAESFKKIIILYRILCTQVASQLTSGVQGPGIFSQCRGFLTSACLEQKWRLWKKREKYTIKPIGVRKTGGRDHTGKSAGTGVCWDVKLKDGGFYGSVWSMWSRKCQTDSPRAMWL